MKYFTKNHLKYGLLTTAIVVVCLLIMEITGNNDSFEKAPVLTVAQMLMPLVFWYLGITHKKKEQKGRLTFKEGVKEGFMISLVFAITSPFIFMLYYVFVNNEIITQTYQQPSMSFSQLVAVDMLAQFISALIFGTLYAAIISFFVKSKK